MVSLALSVERVGSTVCICDVRCPSRESKKAAPAPAPAPAGDAHSNLMAAIRQAGGAGRAQLRPAASTPTKVRLICFESSSWNHQALFTLFE